MSNYYVEINAPFLGVNDSSAEILEWFFNENDKISKGEVLAVLETTKSTFDVIAPSDGILSILCKESEKVEFDQSIALVIFDERNLNKVRNSYKAKKKKEFSLEIGITQKAKEKAREFGISIEQLHDIFDGIIREKDVLKIVQQKDDRKPKKDETTKGLLKKEFMEWLIANDSFNMLPSDEKISLYKENGAIIERGVSIGNGSVIISDSINLKKDSSIGNNCYIRTKKFELGIMSIIGNSSNIVARQVLIGDVCSLSYNTIITGGFSIHASLIIGNSCLVSSNCLFDCGNGVFIGNEVGISPHVKLYTHNHWQSELEGYHSNYGSIYVMDKAYITGDCLVVPGVTIGKGATVLANSTVIKDVLPNTQVCGNPASQVALVNTELSMEKKEQIILRIINNMKKYFDENGIVDQKGVIYMPRFLQSDKTKGKCVLTFVVSELLDNNSLNCVLFDLHSLAIYGAENEYSNEVRNFLRLRGIRFKPIYWRYSGESHLYQD